MPISADNNRLYTEGGKGITLDEIAACLKDYRVTALGRDLGLLATSPYVNKWAKRKFFPFPSVSFETEEEEEQARRSTSSGLLLPTPLNASDIDMNNSEHPARWYTYLGKLLDSMYKGHATNYRYRKPRGISSSYFEPFRVLDMDGYNHLAEQPFDTDLTLIRMGVAEPLKKSLGLPSDVITINRFLHQELRCVIKKMPNSEISMNDMLPDGTAKYHFCAEIYLKASNYNNYDRTPEYVYAYPDNIGDLATSGQILSIPIPEAWEYSKNGSEISVIIGVNSFQDGVNTGGNNIPDSLGKGFVAPYPSDKPMHPIYRLRIEHYAVLDMKLENGFYIANSTISNYSSFELNTYTYQMKNSYSDKVGISLKIKKASENFYVIGSEQYTIPDGVYTYMFRMLNQSTNTYVVGTVTNETIYQNVTNGAALIKSQGDEEQTVYLRFDNLLPSIGSEIKFGVLEVSVDKGKTFAALSEVAEGYSGSSVELYLKRV